jgi:hypothetical protein
MNTTDTNEARILQYLLGELAEEEQGQLEERFFADDALYQEVRVAERELIDRYVLGQLTGRERERFERRFLSSPRRRETVTLARSFRQTIAAVTAQVEPPEVERPTLRDRLVRWLSPRRPYKGLAAALFEATLQKILAALGRSSFSARRLIPWGIGSLAVVAVAWIAYPYYFDDGRLSLRVTPNRNNEMPIARDAAAVASLSGLGAPQPLPRGLNETQTPPDRVVTYHYTQEGTGFRIRYELPYLNRLHQKGEIEGITYGTSPFEAPLPALHVTVTNNTRRNVVITAAVLNIKTSDVPEEVIPIIDDMSQSNLIITNQGWGEVIDPILTLSVSEVEGTFSLFAEERHTVKLEPFSHIKQVPIRDFVPERLRGMDLVKVSGALEYGRPGARQSVKYTTRVLQHILAGRASAPSAGYNAFFRAGESGKQVVVDLQPPQEMKPGETEVFLIRLRSDKSSTTLMQVDFQTIEGRTIRGNEFKIDMFVPRDLRAAWKQEHIGSSR